MAKNVREQVEAVRLDNYQSYMENSAETAKNWLVERSKLNLYQKMAFGYNEIKSVSKNLEIPTSVGKDGTVLRSYKAVSYPDVINACKPFMAKYGIVAVEEEKTILRDETVTTTTKYGEKQERYVRMRVVMRFINADNPQESFLATGYGDGLDSGDKACGKAETYGKKYAFITAFSLSIGEDPDEEASKEYDYNKPQGQPEKPVQQAQQQAQKQTASCPPELINSINFERKELESMGIDVRSEKFMAVVNKNGIETTDPAFLDVTKATKLLSLLRAYKKKVSDKRKQELISADDLPF